MEKREADSELLALNAFIVNCAELNELEKKLGKFNVFRILRFEYGELRHSNVLSWLFQPDESHGLGELFLRKWLMRILLDSTVNAGYPSPVDVDCGEFMSVDVYREWRHIDILIKITTRHQGDWIICIENKVQSTQGATQLNDYRTRIYRYFPNATHRVFVFLTKNRENPDDELYISADYDQVFDALKSSVDEKSDSIGPEPRILMENYLEILSEVFMENSEVAQLARRIYQAHKQALDLIFEHRPDALADISVAVRERLAAQKDELGIIPMAINKGYVRFIPREWNTPANRRGTAWGKEESSYILFEINFWTKSPRFTVVVGEAPLEWSTGLWELTASEPFVRNRRGKQPKKWIIMHSVPSRISMDDLEGSDIDSLADNVTNWVIREYKSDRTEKIRGIISKQLDDLAIILKEKE